MENIRTVEENIEFLRLIKPYYKLNSICPKFNIQRTNLYNMINHNKLTIPAEVLNNIVNYIVEEMKSSIDYLEKKAK